MPKPPSKTVSLSRNAWPRLRGKLACIVGPNCIGLVNAMLDSRVTFMDALIIVSQWSMQPGNARMAE
jgi:hypothetical protein